MDLHGLFPGYHHQIPDLVSKTHVDAAQLLLADDHRVRAEVTRRRLARIVAIDVEAGALKHRIAGLVADTGSSLTGIYGVGPIIAARFMAEVVDINRYPNRNAFASANGTAPLSASSGRTQRHRHGATISGHGHALVVIGNDSLIWPHRDGPIWPRV